jgi:hypothetical protein
MADDKYQSGKVTRPLLLSDLSPAEVEIIREIEARILEAHDDRTPDRRTAQDDYLAYSPTMNRRSLLLNGGRGTGKTSILHTLVRRWNSDEGAEYDKALGDRLKFVRVLPILDFDPLPPGMPLAAGIIQAWRPLVDHCEDIARKGKNWSDSESETLLDRWHKLFRVAAVGWTSIPQETGLIEQVLDREEQVGNWQRLDGKWSEFVDEVIRFIGAIPQSQEDWPEFPIFVIMIDDVDLQVARARELFPAIRLLYHPSVFFIVAAHREHLIDMLTLDFLGKQNEVAGYTGSGELSLWKTATEDRWASTLARSAFQKAFAKPDLFRLERLSLVEWLDFPPQSQTFRGILNRLGRPVDKHKAFEPAHKDLSLGDFVGLFAKLREEQEPGATRVRSYREAQQLADVIFTANDFEGTQNARELLCRLLDRNESEEAGVLKVGDRSVVEVRTVGVVTALFPPEFIEVIFPELQEIRLSGRPRFRFRADGVFNRSRENRHQSDDGLDETVTLLAFSLQDSDRNVLAPGLKWDASISLAWTRWVMKDRGIELAFRWPLHFLPPPIQLYEWASEWAEFIKGLGTESKDLRDRIAYGWIYHQLKWFGKVPNEVANPVVANLDNEEVWKALLDQEPPKDTDLSLGEDRWRRRTLPLLSRPELGFTPKVQERLLDAATVEQSKADLIGERRRLIRDAFDAAAAATEEGRSSIDSAKEENYVNEVLDEIGLQYPNSHWNKVFGSGTDSPSPR